MKKRNFHSSGFTIIEILTVLAVASILLSLSVTAFQSLSRSSGLTAGVSNLSSLLERAQVYAMANSTYVYLGLDTTTSPGDMEVSTMFSPTADSTTTSNLLPVGKSVILSKINLSTALQVQSHVTGAATGTSVVDAAASQIHSIQMQAGGKTYTCNYVIKFAPDGTATAQTNGISRWIQIGLTPNAVASSSPNMALIQVTGLTGCVQVFRP